MTKPTMVSVNLPFDGFYESSYSYAIDREEEQFCEYRCDEYEKDNKDNEVYWPDALKLDAQQYGEILFNVTQYRDCYQHIARDYVAALDHAIGDALEMGVKDKRGAWIDGKFTKVDYVRPSIRMTFEEMTSPREYNFATDRLFAQIPLVVMRHLFKQSKVEKHATFAAVIRERFTSRSGFHSYYSNDVESWLEKPLRDWDHNELGTLLIAGMKMAGLDPESDETRRNLEDATIGDDGAYQAWEKGVDWPAFETKRLEARAEKLAQWIAEDCDAAMRWQASNSGDFAEIVAADPSSFGDVLDSHSLPYRCPETPDLFQVDGR